MTKHYNAFIIVLEQDISEDDAEDTITALKQIKGVLSVTPRVAEIGDHIAKMQVRSELWQKIFQVFQEDKK